MSSLEIIHYCLNLNGNKIEKCKNNKHNNIKIEDSKGTQNTLHFLLILKH